MYVFWCASNSKLHKLEKGKTIEGSFRVYRSLSEVKPKAGQKVMVLYRSKAQTSSWQDRIEKIRPKDVLNIRPFRPTKLVKAGGGYVYRIKKGKPQILLIKRRGVWDLPKGKCDKGETIEECAKREVCEEVGINKVRIVEPLGATFHTYTHRGAFVVKETRWFLMSTKATEFKPQASEQIEKVKFVSLPKVKSKVVFVNLINHASEWESTIEEALAEPLVHV